MIDCEITRVIEEAFPLRSGERELHVSGVKVRSATVECSAQLLVFDDGQLSEIQEQDLVLPIDSAEQMKEAIQIATSRMGQTPAPLPSDLFAEYIPSFYRRAVTPFADQSLPDPKTPRVTSHTLEGLELRTTVRLHPRPANDVPVENSKLGGAILWPMHDPWPRCEEHASAFVPILQIRKEDVPELGFPNTSDLFQLLWCPFDHEQYDYAPRPETRWRETADMVGGENRKPPNPANNHDDVYIPTTCRLFPERVEELPCPFELPPGGDEARDDTLRRIAAEDIQRLAIPPGPGLYQHHFSAAPGTKVGGYAQWIQDPNIPLCGCGRKMEYMLSVASFEADGAWQRWMPLAERSLPPALKQTVRGPTQLMLGDAGTYYLFVCRRCEPWPVAMVMQCS